MFVIEQPIPPANSAAQVLAEWNAVYDVYNEELKSMFEKQAGVERFDLIQTFHACKQEEVKPVGPYVIKMKGYVEQLERFLRNYNIHNMGNMIGELHTLLVEYEKGLPKKAATPQVIAIQGKGKGKDQPVYIPKPKNLIPSAKENPAKDNACHHCKEVGHFHRLVENGFVQCFTDFGISVSKNNVHYFNAIPSNGIYEIDMHDLVPNNILFSNVSSKRDKRNLVLLICGIAMCVVYLDMCQEGASYFITFTDDYSRYGYVYLLKHKHEVFETFKVFKNEVENQLGKTIKALRSDRGGEYISQEFKDYLKDCGIVQQLTPPYTPQHNRVSERRNQSATRILNMVPTKKVDKTPYELWYGKVPNLSYLKVWGCEALVKRDTPDKLQQRSVKCIFIGYPKETMGYYFYFPPENKIVVASEIHMEVEGFEPPQEEVIPIRRSERTHRAPERLCLNVEWDHCYECGNAFLDTIIWYWVLVDLPPNCKTVGSKWLFKIKTDMDGNVHTYKARLVAKGYTQLYGVDYEEMFSPVADIRMDNQVGGHIPMQKDLNLNKKHKDASTPERSVKSMQSILMLLGCGINGKPHWTAVKTILKYLRNTKDMFLVYGGNPEAELRVECYCDAGFETDRDDTKSQTGYVFILNGGAVDWKSSKQSTTAMSATEAEYIAAMEAVWIRKFISGLGIVPTINEPIKMFCDNSAALHFANEPGVQRGARHYHRRYHYVHESIALGEIKLLKVHTDDNLVDSYSKLYPNGKINSTLLGALGLSFMLVVSCRSVFSI
ncbi:retrotransposon protein, putative, ty1-copia subclass [Tanacetum coccineum]|uniref:Retrotransposon protein, putative, ty1-copia subclass n=1 Tax=Tanacetum coccineum TaxID=301880 RepID=A0ABQ5CUJ6_9ASTR